MRKMGIVTLLLLAVGAGAAQAGVIRDVQMGLVPVNTVVTVEDAIVTGVRYNGLFISEIPNGPYAGIWVYTGTYAHGLVEGDLCSVQAKYIEYYDLSELDFNATPTADRFIYKTGEGPIFPSYCVTIPQLNADPEQFESCFICVTDGMTVTTAPNSYGEWIVELWGNPAQTLRFDDYWYDDTTVMVGHCYNWAGGILYYGFGNFMLEAFAGERGIQIVDCAVPTTPMSFGAVKALYR
jgi:hypothetical protein